MLVTVQCAYCGKDVTRHEYQIRGKKRIFCSRDCQNKHRSKKYNPSGYLYVDYTENANRFRRINAETNKHRMTPEVREKIRLSRAGVGNGKAYPKVYGRHEHRRIMEAMLGRPLLSTEIVHHIDGNRLNNSPSNLQLFANQAEHARWHMLHRSQGGDA